MTAAKRAWLHNIFFQIIILVLLSTITALIFNYFSRNGIPLINDDPAAFSSKEISVEQAFRLLDEVQTLFIDTRSPEEFAQGHIKRSVNVPAKWSMDQIMNFFDTLPKDRLLVIYCSGVECNSSQRLAGFLTQLEFRTVMVFPDGYKIWLTKNYPVDLPEKISGVK